MPANGGGFVTAIDRHLPTLATGGSPERLRDGEPGLRTNALFYAAGQGASIGWAHRRSAPLAAAVLMPRSIVSEVVSTRISKGTATGPAIPAAP